jgi:hypothetical protein
MNEPSHELEEVEIDPALDPAIQKQLIDAERQNARRGQILGVVIIALGIDLILAGVSGAVDAQFSGMGLTTKLTKASPGLVIAVIGLVVIWRTNLSIKSGKKKR